MKKRMLAVLLAFVLAFSGICVMEPAMAEEVKATDTNNASAEIEADTPDADMLSIKIQPRQNDPQNTPNDETDDTIDLRLVSSVNGLGYESVGFEVYFTSDDNAKPEDCTPVTFDTQTVLERINAKTTGVTYKYSPKVIDTSSEYFVTGVIMGVLYKNWDNDFYVRAYCTKLGTDEKVYGAGRYFNINDMRSTGTINITLPTTTQPNADATTKAVTDSVTIGAESTATTATLKYYDADNGYAYLNVAVPAGATVNASTNKTMLASASKVTVAGESTVYRNLESKYENQGKDSSWYSVYDGIDSAETKFVIATSADLYGLAAVTNTATGVAGKTFYLVADIEANDGTATLEESDGWDSTTTPIAWTKVGTYAYPFAGVFDGQGHTLSGLYMKATEQYVGMFGRTSPDCYIQNFTLANSYFESYTTTGTGSAARAYLGSISGYGGGHFTNVKSEALILSHLPRVAGILGNMDSNTYFTGCSFSGTLSRDEGVTTSGGIVAINESSAILTIDSCLFDGTIIDNNTVAKTLETGGFLGVAYGGTVNISNCLSVGSLSYQVAQNWNGSLIGRTNSNPTVTVTDTYVKSADGFSNVITYQSGTVTYDGVSYTTTATITSNHPKLNEITGLDGWYNTTLDFGTYWSAVSEATPQLTSFTKGSVLQTLGGRGTEAEPWEIGTEDELKLLAEYVNDTDAPYDFSGKYVALTNDIALSNVKTKENWVPIGKGAVAANNNPNTTGSYPFAGTFDGKMNTISGLYYKGDGQIIGLFGYIANAATIQNLYLGKDCYFETTAVDGTPVYMGSVVGWTQGTLNTIKSSATISTNCIYNGGIAGTVFYSGAADATIKTVSFSDCWFAGKIISRNESARYTGGIVGRIYAPNRDIEVNHCLVSGDIQVYKPDSESYAGGICGGAGGEKCYRNLTISDTLVSSILKSTYEDFDRCNVDTAAILGRVEDTDKYALTGVYGVNGLADDGNTYTYSISGTTYSVEPDITSANYAMIDIAQFSAEGADATTLLPGLSWTGDDAHWTAVEGSTPILSCFATQASE